MNTAWKLIPIFSKKTYKRLVAMNSATLTADHDDLGQLLTEAGDPNTTEQRLRDLLSLNHPEVTVAVAKNTLLKADELTELSQHPNLQVRLAVAGNPSSDGHILEQLAEDSTEEVRARVAASEKATPSMLLRLAEDPASRVRQKVIENKHSSIEVLQRLAQDNDPAVLVGLAHHPQATSDLLAGLSEKKSLQVKTAVAQNIRTPVAGLLLIAQEIDRSTAAETFSLRQALAANPNSPHLILSKCLSRNDPSELQEKIALHLSRHLNSPDDLLDGMAEYNSLPIQENIVNHPYIHHPTLVKMASSNFWSIQQQALQRINAAPATIDRQTYIGEAEESIDSELISLPESPNKLPNSEILDITLISSGDLYQPPPMRQNVNWEGQTGLSGLSELYERTGAQLNAIHPLAILFTMITLLCVALSLNTWVNSTSKQVTGNALIPNGLNQTPKNTSAVSAKNEVSNYNQAINIANMATLASQTANNKQDWEKISVQWGKAISLLKAVPVGDPQYPKAQNKLSEYQTINNVAKNKAR
jgi:hypothetical protein